MDVVQKRYCKAKSTSIKSCSEREPLLMVESQGWGEGWFESGGAHASREPTLLGGEQGQQGAHRAMAVLVK